MNVLLRNLRWWTAEGGGAGDLRVRGRRIVELGTRLPPRTGEAVLDVEGHLALPGLINAHDHLGLDLLPFLGSPPYRSFYSWAEEIYRPTEPPIRQLLELPLSQRLLWGGYKNLISGVTRVVHHDPFHWRLRVRFPVRVLRRYGFAHSLGFGPDVRRAHRRSRGRRFFIHAAEGLDERAKEEVDRLEELGVLGPSTVLVHGVGLEERHVALLEKRSCALVWCPSSNLALYGRTAPVATLRGRVPVLLGTDSTLSGAPTLLAELRAALSTGQASAEELLRMVTSEAAAALGLEAGHLRVGAQADLILLPDDEDESAAEVLLRSRPADLALVLVKGRVGLASEVLAARLGLGPCRLRVEGAPKWTVGRPDRLRRRIARRAGEIFDENPLWQAIQAPQPARLAVR